MYTPENNMCPTTYHTYATNTYKGLHITGRLGVLAKAASSRKAGEALQSLAWAVELLSFCIDTSGSEPSANGDHAEQCLIHKVCTPRTVFFHLGFTRFNS